LLQITPAPHYGDIQHQTLAPFTGDLMRLANLVSMQTAALYLTVSDLSDKMKQGISGHGGLLECRIEVSLLAIFFVHKQNIQHILAASSQTVWNVSWISLSKNNQTYFTPKLNSFGSIKIEVSCFTFINN
jgi:hypothetical protein